VRQDQADQIKTFHDLINNALTGVEDVVRKRKRTEDSSEDDDNVDLDDSDDCQDD
jgi:hypothetical protein